MMHPQQPQELSNYAVGPPPGMDMPTGGQYPAQEYSQELERAPTDNSAEMQAELALQELGYVSDGDRHANV